MRTLQVEANVIEMKRARAMTSLFLEYSSDVQARRADDPYFTAAPLAETITETQPVTGQTAGRIRTELETVLIVDQHLPWLAEHLDAGRIDLYRAKPVIDAFKDDLADHPKARERFAELMQTWFARAAETSPDLLNKTISQIRNHTHYVVTKVLAGEFDDRFRRRHRSRGVRAHSTGDGMGALTIDTDLVSVKKAEHHLDLLARDARSAGDERTLEQLKADLAIDLLTGRAVGSAEGRTAEGGTTAVGRWARPIINITVPLETVMGLSDEPGRMGDHTLPAALVRHVAAQPESTWYRLLTDKDRRGVELSTTSYRPTAAIWREVVARQPTCFAPTCDRPATETELDHTTRYPEGATSTANLGPACGRHHRSKHVRGASLRRGSDGVLRYTTRAGLTHLVAPAEQPVADDPRAAEIWRLLSEKAPTTQELSDAIELVRYSHRSAGPDSLDLEARRRAKAERAYRASYPEASEEDIEHWVWDPDAEAPPLVRGRLPLWDVEPDEYEYGLSPLAVPHAGSVAS